MAARKKTEKAEPEAAPVPQPGEVLVFKSFQAVRPGEIYPDTIEEGEILTGNLGDVAVELECGDRTPEEPAK